MSLKILTVALPAKIPERQRQRNRASATRKNTKTVKVSVSKWSGHNEHRHNAIALNFVAFKHGNVVAAHCHNTTVISDTFSTQRK